MIILLPAYTCSMASTLILPLRHKPLETFHDLANCHACDFRVPEGSYYENIFHQSNDQTLQKISKKLKNQKERYSQQRKALINMMQSQNLVYPGDKVQLEIERGMEFTDRFGKQSHCCTTGSLIINGGTLFRRFLYSLIKRNHS